MDYLFLLFAILAFSVQSVFSKQYQLSAKAGLKSGLSFSLVRSIFALIFFLILSSFNLTFSKSAFLFAFIYSISSIICSVSSVLAMDLGSLGKVSMFMLSGGLILPFIAGILVWNEELSLMKLLGSLIIIIAFILPNIDKDKSKNKISFILLCAVIFLTNGFVSISSKAAEVAKDRVPTNNFLFLASLITLVFTSLILGFLSLKKEKLAPFKFKTSFLIPIGLYALMNSIGNIFSLRASRRLDASFQFPILSAAIVVLTVLLAFIVFKEKPSKKDFVALLLNVAGIVLFII